MNPEASLLRHFGTPYRGWSAAASLVLHKTCVSKHGAFLDLKGKGEFLHLQQQYLGCDESTSFSVGSRHLLFDVKLFAFDFNEFGMTHTTYRWIGLSADGQK